ncbi:zf-HC2 domain-containing protein (plasmid) [Pseudorhodobacter turbinis]|uniref:Zf-HC2 domain-containing protein n=1 Tax=Pseudorhodobacter turbinis TaxID=2500533 RepID=A0A4P8EL93_9RHOB|nr:zf-HC2 domain-containing protein [Pseudorhodobacter turbinis]QCO57817.1 zf-HC2 domain-containing protein [Pseudorhodobacter turbinis]
MLSCKEVAARASDLIDGELSTWESLQMRLHLAMCKGCEQFVNQVRTTRDLTRIAVAQSKLDEADDGRISAILSTLREGK